jgi:hypothetical protein
MERFRENILIINPDWEQQDLFNFCIRNFEHIHSIFFDKKNFHNTKYNFKSKILLNHLEKIKAYNFVKNKNIKLIFADQCDYSLYLQSYLINKLRINGPTLVNGELSYDKSKLYKVCRKKKILVPEFWIFKKIPKKYYFENILKNKNSLISKPVDNRGSIGVNILNSLNFKKSIGNSLNHSIQKKIIVQKYVCGKNIIIESTGATIELIGIKEMSQNQKYLNNDIIFFRPDSKKALHKKLILNHIKAVKKLGFDKGFVSAEYIVEKEKIWLIEITNRGGGVGISSKIKSKILGYNSYINLLKDFYKKKTIIKELKKINKVRKAKLIYLKYILLNKCISKNNYKKIKKIFYQNKNFLFFKIWNFNNIHIKNIKDSTDRNGVIISHHRTINGNKSIIQNFLNQYLKTH